MNLYSPRGKRIVDVIVAGIGIVLFIPLLIVTSIAILIQDGPPVLFRQQRVGRHGRPFKILKFRTMSNFGALEVSQFELGNRSRITVLGKFLRRHKIDELPQLVNVILGDMSLIGPRPEVEQWTKIYPEKWREVLTVRPGITDFASVEFRDEESLLAKSNDPDMTYRNVILPRKLEYYAAYVRNVRLLTDIRILKRTVMTLLGYSP